MRTFKETAGSNIVSILSDYVTEGGVSSGTPINKYMQVQVMCRALGHPVSDGDQWWYQLASNPWSYMFWTSADPYYNNGKTSGPLVGTPFFDHNVPICESLPTKAETAGVAIDSVWSDYENGGGVRGTQINQFETVHVVCRALGLAVEGGNRWWYQLASSPSYFRFWASADNFYNDGATSGSLQGNGPPYDPYVPVCSQP